MPTHTPTLELPLRQGKKGQECYAFDATGWAVIHATESPELLANIIHRVNAHDELVQALDAVVNQLALWPGEKNPEYFPCMKAARALLENTKGTPA